MAPYLCGFPPPIHEPSFIMRKIIKQIPIGEHSAKYLSIPQNCPSHQKLGKGEIVTAKSRLRRQGTKCNMEYLMQSWNQEEKKKRTLGET